MRHIDFLIGKNDMRGQEEWTCVNVDVHRIIYRSSDMYVYNMIINTFLYSKTDVARAPCATCATRVTLIFFATGDWGPCYNFHIP